MKLRTMPGKKLSFNYRVGLLTVLGLGSNLGNSPKTITNAIIELEKILKDLRSASFYESEPLYVTDQAVFINTAVSGFFSAGPGELLEQIHDIEARFGRNRSREIRWGERSLDIDILLFGNAVYSADNLTIPHPRLRERRFALEPLLELLPDASCPETGIPFREICYMLADQGVKKIDLFPFTSSA